MSHGNAYDIGSAYYEVQNFSKQFKVKEFFHVVLFF